MLPFAILAFYIDNGVSRAVFLLISLIFFVLIFSIEVYRLKRQHLHQKLMKKISHLYKEHEQNRFLSTILSPVVLILLGLFFSKVTILATICMGGLSDSLAAIIGIKYGGKANKAGKTRVGSIAYFGFTFLFTYLSVYLLHSTVNILFIFILSLVAAFFERHCNSQKNLLLDDDLIVPMAFASLMEIGIRIMGA